MFVVFLSKLQSEVRSVVRSLCLCVCKNVHCHCRARRRTLQKLEFIEDDLILMVNEVQMFIAIGNLVTIFEMDLDWILTIDNKNCISFSQQSHNLLA